MPLVYDFEVFQHDWILVAKDISTKERTIIHNDRSKLIDFYNNNKNKIWVGFNSAHYDIYILKAIICGFNPKTVNDYIIQEDQPGWSYNRRAFEKIPINNYDVFTDSNGLKTLEGFMGSNIQESSVPWDIQRPLNPTELAEVIQYCCHDVEETGKVFIHRWADFTAHTGLLEMYNLPTFHVNKSKAQLSAFILGARKRPNIDIDEMAFELPDTLRINKYKHIMDWYLNPKNRNYEKSQIVYVCGIPHKFAWGGLHGAVGEIIKKRKIVDIEYHPYYGKGIYLHIDVNSYYPSLMLRYGWMSRAVPSDKLFREIYNLRLQYKKTKDKRQQPLKIVLNGTYGAMKDKTNPLYDPRMANSICVGGQLLLLDLLEHLEGHCDIINSNTDGIIVKIASEDKIDDVKSICKEWEERTGMGLGYDFFESIYQLNVNSYLMMNGDYFESKKDLKEPTILDNDLPIIRTALINYMTKGISPRKTIMDCNDLMQFQQIVKVSRKFDCAVMVNSCGQTILEGKYFRVFASTRSNDGTIKRGKGYVTDLFGNDVVKETIKFPGTSSRCFIDNGDVAGKPCPSYLDKGYYVEKANKILKKFGVKV